LKDLIPSMNLNIPGLGAVNPGAMAGKGISVLDDEVGKDIDPILDFALHSLHDKMQSARLAAMNNKSMTMEVYLAQLPMLIALMARNTFFPVWQLIAEKVFGALGAGAALAMSPVASMMQKAKNAASDAGKKAQDLDSKVKSAANNAASSADSAASRLGGNPLGGAADGLASQAGSLADSVLGTGSSGQGGSGSSASSGGFPGSARLNQGMGIDITKSEWDDVDSNQKVTVE
jgi:hypothetical protein